MIKILAIIFLTFNIINASELTLINGNIKILNLKNISKDKIVNINIFEPYTKEYTNFQGIILKEFVQTYGLKHNTLILTALDDYKIEFSKKEIEDKNIILAFKEKNVYLAPDTKGPLRIIYKDYKKDKNAIYLTKWIWMIVKAEFK